MPELGKITLDLDRLVGEERLSKEEAERLAHLKEAAPLAGHLINVLYIIGALAAAAGVVLLKPAAITGLIIAVICLIIGQYIMRKGWEHLRILSLALGIGAAAGLIGWFVLEFGESVSAIAVHAFATVTILIIAVLFRSRFLSAFVPVGIGAMIGSGAAYWHASYGIFVRESLVTIIVFTLLSVALYWLAKRLRARDEDWSGMATVAARMSLILTNLGFWVGSLWGDYVGEHLLGYSDRAVGQKWETLNAARNAFRETAFYIHEDIFALGWAAFAIAMIVLGNKTGRRFVATSGVVFLAINAFTQYFEYFQDEPWALIFGGIALVAVALGLVRWELRKRRNAGNPISLTGEN